VCSPGGMVRLVHAVVKNFLLAFKVGPPALQVAE
jgi:hypothetical protein